MTENQRETFRVEPSSDLYAELFHEGRVTPCALENLSAGGARARTSLAMPPGAQCTLGVRLGESVRRSDRTPAYVSFLMEVIERSTAPDGRYDYRLRSTTGPGSDQYEEAAKLVFTVQRTQLAKRSGSDEASPMAAEPERRRRLRSVLRRRFSRRSVRGPAFEDD